MLEANHIVYKYEDGTKALNDVTVKVNDNEIVALLGKNGAGKSTLFLHFNGIFKPDKGEVLVEGKPIKYNNKGLLDVRSKVGVVFQNPDDQLFAPTVQEDVAFGPLNLGLSQEEVENRVKESLKKVGMSGFERKPPHHLSGGQKKRVAIAGVLAMKPKIMVLDEPTSGLDPKGASQVLKLLYKLNSEGISIIISTHDVDLVPLYANRLYVIKEGQIIKEGTPSEVFSDVKTIRGANLRLPRIAHLAEILEKEDSIDFEGEYPLTISQARNQFLEKLDL
ncbi:MAG: ATP-binding cassette domain-containing protein [Methanobacteriaceae archaeon]|jgi:cobalt/nickel transport system ATP-binding protein|uniref:ATP-binding cassette domain-containing protein n=1 Tax=unclassified Methanobrevibacter TaxID=2638681 RepID=UPI002A0F6F06|nr:ATP-binding cassette domain-containing protein [Methanobacteriaceae archaeon]MDD3408920.1 ATP-binding cassette domain-containing protein [Methanobacteriaceae archaeon]MDD4594582.1 ATP-binding cassette domain-containing protein [Methanobacteriaceae archaeon]